MWARLQGVGISVRVDTALPWPLPLLHKTSQPALSPGLESVSDAIRRIKAKNNKTKTVPSVFLLVSPAIPLPPRLFSFALVHFLPHCWIALPVWPTSHHICLQLCLFYQLILPSSYFFPISWILHRETHDQPHRRKLKHDELKQSQLIMSFSGWCRSVFRFPFCLLFILIIAAQRASEHLDASCSCQWWRVTSCLSSWAPAGWI